MKYINLIVVFLLLISFACSSSPESNNDAGDTADDTEQAQQVKVVKFDQLQKLRNSITDTLYVVNFWASWCGPCLKEMPYFEAINRQYKDRPVRVLLVSMDAVQDLQKVKAFMQKRKLTSKVWLLNETDANTWIDKLEPKWSGAIPATMLFNNRLRQYYFVEKELKENELEALINKFKPKP